MPPTMRMEAQETPILPMDYRLEYVAEGRANIVYRILPASSNSTSSESFKGKLLRLRKDVPTTRPCLESQEDWLRLVQPLFATEELVEQSLVDLRGTKIVHSLNERLRELERSAELSSHRPAERVGVYLADEYYGLLVTDMTPKSPTEFIFEFKPKWLSQSPNAPPNSRRCRQCARVARRNAERSRSGERKLSTYCPLDLISKDARDVAFVVKKLCGNISTRRMLQIAGWLEGNQMLQHLANYQRSLDRAGILKADPSDEDFLVAMTLRDCSVFVRFPEVVNEASEARIGDLDLKSIRKWEYWKDIERTLIDQRWYVGLEMSEQWQPIECHVSPNRRNRRRKSI